MLTFMLPTLENGGFDFRRPRRTEKMFPTLEYQVRAILAHTLIARLLLFQDVNPGRVLLVGQL